MDDYDVSSGNENEDGEVDIEAVEIEAPHDTGEVGSVSEDTEIGVEKSDSIVGASLDKGSEINISDSEKVAEVGSSAESSFELTEEMDKALTTPENSAVFWSGTGANAAREYAESIDKTTLEKQLDDNNIKVAEFDPTKPETLDQWHGLSRSFAEKASGEISVVMGDKVSAQSTFAQIEYPALMKNENVSKITVINLNTKEEMVIFDRNNPATNKEMVSYTPEGSDLEFIKFE